MFEVVIWRLWFWRNQNQFNKLSTKSISVAQGVLIRAEEITSSNKSGLNGLTRKVEKWKNGLGGNPLYGLGANSTPMVLVKEIRVLLLEEFYRTPTGIGLVVSR